MSFSNKKSITFSLSENIFIFEGIFSDEIYNDLIAKMEAENDYIFDFINVKKINYSGVRSLLLIKKNGFKFELINLNEEVTKFLKSCKYIYDPSFVDQPIEICLENYEEFGGGFTSRTFFEKSKDSMLKLYQPFVSVDVIKEEKRRANETLLLGVSTPLCGEFVKTGESYGLTFERINNKKSIARLLADEKNNSKFLAKIMAEFTLDLHSKKCNTELFPNKKELLINDIENNNAFSFIEKEKLISFVKSIPDSNNCLHGDFQIGNIIRTDLGDLYFIDMGDFAYGSYLFDLGDLYFNMNSPKKALVEELYHCEYSVLNQFWRDFIYEYMHLSSEFEIDKISEEMKKYGALTMIHYARRVNMEPWMKDLILDWLLNKI